MDFNSIVSDGMTPKVDPYPWMEDKTFTLVRDIEHLKEIVDRAINAGLCALDLETTGLDSRIDFATRRTQDQIVGYCISYDGEEGLYVPVGHKIKSKNGDGLMHQANLHKTEAAREIKRLCENCITVYHNSAFDLEFLYGLGANVDIDIDSHVMFEDTLILDYLRDSTDKRHGLKHLSKRFLGLEMIELKQLFRTGTKDLDFSTLDPTKEETLWYAGSDAICTYRLLEFYKQHAPDVENYPHNKPLPKSEWGGPKSIYGEQKTVYDVEKMLIPALRWTERNRPKVDLPYVKRLKDEVKEYIDDTVSEIEKELAEGIKNELGDPIYIDVQAFRNNFDVRSPQQLGKALRQLKNTNAAFSNVELEETENTKQVKTNNEAIEKLAEQYGQRFPFLEKIQTFRKLQKVLGTYITPIYENTDWEGNPKGATNKIKDGTIRFRFLPHRVDTGRFAASKGRPAHGYSGINVQSTPATYNYAKFKVKRILERPEGPGEEDAKLIKGFTSAVESTDFLKRVYDNHFIQENKTGDEFCIRESCEGCPFASECEHEEPVKKQFYSLEAAIRPSIVAREGYVLCAIDYSGLELRVAANICEEPKWIEEFYRCGKCDRQFEPPEKDVQRPNNTWKWKVKERPPARCPDCGSDKIGDLHTLTAKIVYGENVTNLPPSEFKQKRQGAKASNFAIIYGGGGGAVARATGVDSKGGWEIRNKILKRLSKFGKWMDTTIAKAHQNREVATAIGRKVRLHNINSSEDWLRAKQERNAINSIVQGSATGDLIKYAMGAVYRAVKERNWWDVCRMVFTVHDELVFEIREDMLDEVLPVLDDCMTQFGDKMKWPITLATDVEFAKDWTPGHDWREIHNIDNETGIANDGVPSYLVGSIEFSEGMWYEDADGNQRIWNGSEFLSLDAYEDYFEAKKAAASVDDDDDDNGDGGTGNDNNGNLNSSSDQNQQQTKDANMSQQNEQPKKNRLDLPVYEYKTKVPLTEKVSVLSYLMRLQRVTDACKSFIHAKKVKPTHALCVKSVQGDVLLGPEERVAIDPEVFDLLAFYEGI